MSTLRRSIPLALLAAVALAFLLWPLALNAQPADGGVNVTATVQLDAPPAPPVVDAGAGSGSAVVVQVDPATGSATSSDGTIDTLPEVKAAYDELHADYAALQNAKPTEKTFLFAVMLAAILKYALDGVNALGKWRYSKSMGWVALFLAVPIALLTKYIASKSWIEALILAGSGPGAIVVHELLAKLKRGTATPPAPPATT
jgi:hypothetical protein